MGSHLLFELKTTWRRFADVKRVSGHRSGGKRTHSEGAEKLRVHVNIYRWRALLQVRGRYPNYILVPANIDFSVFRQSSFLAAIYGVAIENSMTLC